MIGLQLQISTACFTNLQLEGLLERVDKMSLMVSSPIRRIDGSVRTYSYKSVLIFTFLGVGGVPQKTGLIIFQSCTKSTENTSVKGEESCESNQRGGEYSHLGTHSPLLKKS